MKINRFEIFMIILIYFGYFYMIAARVTNPNDLEIAVLGTAFLPTIAIYLLIIRFFDYVERKSKWED